MKVLVGTILSLLSAAAWAGVPSGTVPEPGTLGLLAAAAGVGLAFSRRKKK